MNNLNVCSAHLSLYTRSWFNYEHSLTILLLSMLMQSFILWQHVVFLSGSEYAHIFMICLYMSCRWRSSFLEGKLLADFTPPCFVPVPSQDWISNVICRGLFCVQWVQLRWEVIVHFVDIGRIVNHHCFNFIFIINIRPRQYNALLQFVSVVVLIKWRQG